MYILKSIFNLLAQVPFWAWLIALVIILVPTACYAVKRSAKVLFIIVCIAAVLFIFPSILTSFMNRAGLTYNQETGVLTNRDGQSIQFNLPKDSNDVTQTDVDKILNQMKDTGITIQDLLNSSGAAKELGEYIKDLQDSVSNGTETDSKTLDDLINSVTPQE